MTSDGGSMTVDGRVDELTCEVYVVPTDRPEADGTLSWSSTTMVVVQVRGAGSEGLGWTYAGAGTKDVIDRRLWPMSSLGSDVFGVPSA